MLIPIYHGTQIMNREIDSRTKKAWPLRLWFLHD